MICWTFSRPGDLLLPPTLKEICVDFQVAQQMRLLVTDVHRAAGGVEMAFLLSGDPPTLDRPARIRDVEPLDSISSAGHVLVEPESFLKAHDELLQRHPQELNRTLAIAHSHPGGGKPWRSGIDEQWHSDCLDMNWRQDLVLPVQERRRRGGREELHSRRLQVFYSLVLPSSGRLKKAVAYLLARSEGEEAWEDREFEIPVRCTESEEARRAVAKLLPVVEPGPGFDVALRYGPPRSEAAAMPVPPAPSSAARGVH